jgi:hypothetical protein
LRRYLATRQACVSVQFTGPPPCDVRGGGNVLAGSYGVAISSCALAVDAWTIGRTQRNPQRDRLAGKTGDPDEPLF